MFPKKIYVQIMKEKDEKWLMVSEDLTEALEQDLCDNTAGEKVAIYQLIEKGSIQRNAPRWVPKNK